MLTLDLIKQRFMTKTVLTPNGCLNWTASKFKDGYGQFRHDASRPNVRAHRDAWELFQGPIPDGFQVLHRCDNPACVNVDHLFLGTHQDNVLDKVCKKRHRTVKGNISPNLTDIQIDEIRALGAVKTQKEIGLLYGISQAGVWKILHGKIRSTQTMVETGAGFTGKARNKLSSSQRGAVVSGRRAGLTQEVLAAQFGVNQTTISRILKGHNNGIAK